MDAGSKWGTFVKAGGRDMEKVDEFPGKTMSCFHKFFLMFCMYEYTQGISDYEIMMCSLVYVRSGNLQTIVYEYYEL